MFVFIFITLRNGSKKILLKFVACNPAIAFLGMYLEKTIKQKHPCIPMFTTALFTKPGHGSRVNVHRKTNDKRDVVLIYNEILLSHEREQNYAICRYTDGNRDCHAEWSKPETENKYHLILLIYVESRKMRKMNLLTSNEYVLSDTPGPLKRKDKWMNG